MARHPYRFRPAFHTPSRTPDGSAFDMRIPPTSTASRLARPAAEWILRRGLRTSFSNIWLLGDADVPPADRPLILYLNHHTYMDGHLAWLFAKRVLRRPAVTWMQEWDRYPFFRGAGALPFPQNNTARRSRTIRSTRAMMAENPSTVLVLFPEGRLHPAEEGILSFPPLERIGVILNAVWCPLAIHVSWRQADRPDAFLKLGRWHEQITGDEQAKLEELVESARDDSLEPQSRIFEGRKGIDKRVDLRILARWFG